MLRSDNLQEWPAEGLEYLGACPNCRSPRRETAHSGVRDIVFGCAPGQWTCHRCQACGVGYLDPRPNGATIAMAYSSYFTHGGVGRVELERLTPVQYGLRLIANGYRNRYFGSREVPASPFLGGLVAVVSPLRRHFDASFRGLSAADAGRRVLDVGCGGGNFLYWARALGCEVVGCDLDAVAVENGRISGFDVRSGGIEAFEDEPESFDFVSFAHVIEHLHDPVRALHVAWRILRPGGTLWLETPNFDSRGHRRFGSAWRGLEVPRHLIIFTPGALRATLESIGYGEVRMHAANGRGVLRESARLASEGVRGAVYACVADAGSELIRMTARKV